MSGPSDNRPFSMGISGLMILGVITFILPIFFDIFSIALPSYTFKIGITLIVIGVIDTMFTRWFII